MSHCTVDIKRARTSKEKVERRAYLIWLQFGLNDAPANWFEAERQIADEENSKSILCKNNNSCNRQ